MFNISQTSGPNTEKQFDSPNHHGYSAPDLVSSAANLLDYTMENGMCSSITGLGLDGKPCARSPRLQRLEGDPTPNDAALGATTHGVSAADHAYGACFWAVFS